MLRPMTSMRTRHRSLGAAINRADLHGRAAPAPPPLMRMCRGEGLARNQRNNPMQGKLPMHLSRRRRAIRTDGFRPWEQADVDQFIARHPIGTVAYLALVLLLDSGQRRGDVIRMGANRSFAPRTTSPVPKRSPSKVSRCW